MENKSLKPKIRFKGFTEAWEQRKFGECVLIQRGGSPRPIESYLTTDNINGINWIKIGDVKAGERYITKTAEKIISEGVKNSREVFPGDLILSNSMSFGRPYIMGVYGCIHDGWLVIKDTNNLFDKEYLLQLLSSEYMYNQYRQLASGGVVNNLNSELVQNTNILLTNMEEQKKLGLIFKSIDNLITLHQRKCDKLVNIKKSLLEKMFPKNGNNVPEIRFKGFTEAWEQRKLDEIMDRYDNLRVPVAANLRIKGDTPYYGANGIQDYVKGYTHNGEFILVAEDGANDLKNYPVQYVNGYIWANNHVHVLQAKKEKANNKFIKYAISQTNIESLLVGGGRAKLNANIMMEIELKMPNNLQEQSLIGNIISKIDNLITLHQHNPSLTIQSS